MNKIVVQFTALVLLFFAFLFALRQVDWMQFFEVKRINNTTDEKLGEMYWDFIKTTENEITTKASISPVDSLLTVLCSKNSIPRKSIKLHLVENSQVNAFALPGGHLVVYTALITECKNEAELCGVLGHEIAHIQKKHVMKKLGKEVGLSVLISITAGSSGGKIIKETLKFLTSTAYDRELEREADKTSVEYMVKAKLNPSNFADFLYRLTTENEQSDAITGWVSTHPDSQERAELILGYFNKKEIKEQSILNQDQWLDLKKSVADLTKN